MRTARLGCTARLSLLCSALALSGCAGYQNHTDGMRLAADGNGEAALPLLRMAAQADPVNGEYRIDLLRETARYVGDLLARADEARRNNQPEVARDLYAKVLDAFAAAFHVQYDITTYKDEVLVSHSTFGYLIDPLGRTRVKIGLDATPAQIAADVRVLLAAP